MSPDNLRQIPEFEQGHPKQEAALRMNTLVRSLGGRMTNYEAYSDVGGTDRGLDVVFPSIGNSDVAPIPNIFGKPVEVLDIGFNNNGENGWAVTVLVDGVEVQFSHLKNEPTSFKVGDTIPSNGSFGLQGNTGASRGDHTDIRVGDANTPVEERDRLLYGLIRNRS